MFIRVRSVQVYICAILEVLVLIEFLCLVFQHRECIYRCLTPLCDEDQCSYKVHDVADMQAASVPPVDEYVFDSTVGSDNEAIATSRRAPSKVVAPRRTRQTAGKISASQAATQAVEAKKRKRKRTRFAVSADTTTICSDVETIDAKGNCGSICGDTSQGGVAGKAGGRDTPQGVKDARAPYVEHRSGGRPWVTQKGEEGPT
jgi:hypothetical protein